VGTYSLILIAVLIISPLALTLAEKQDKKTKTGLKNIFLFLLIAQITLGIFNWESFAGPGRSGWQLAAGFPPSLLWIFFAITAIQILLLLQSFSPAQTLVVFLNFTNTVVFFIALSRLSWALNFQAVSLASIATAFTILIGNVIGLLLINKEGRLRMKPSTNKQKFIALLIALITALILGISFRNQKLRTQVISKVSSLSEVKEYLRTVPSGQVVIDHEDKDTNSYLIHVYEIKDDHTATFNWYEVNKDTGEIKTEF